MSGKIVKILSTFLSLSFLLAPTAIAAGSNASPAPMGGTFFSVDVPQNVLDTKLFGIDGKPITLGQYKGKYVVLGSFLTSCQEICPMTSVNMLAIANAVKKAKLSSSVKVLEVSVDAERDTAKRLKAYQGLFNDYSWTIAGGTESNLHALWKFFGVSANKEMYSAADLKDLPVDWQTGKKNTFDIVHTDEIAIISPDQKWAWLDLGNPDIMKNTVPDKLKAFLGAQGIKNIAQPEQPTWNTTAVTAALSQLLNKKIG